MRDVAEFAEEVACGELAAGHQLTRGVDRCEHQVRRNRDLVELGHGVTGEVGGHRCGDGLELVRRHRVVVVGRPVTTDQRRRGQAVVLDQPSDGLHVGYPRLATA